MNQVTKTQAIKAFLNQNTHPDLAGLYSHAMECQVLVSKDQGDRVDGDFKGRAWHGYTDGIQTWKPIRIPYNANTNPEFNDSPMTWDLSLHAEGVGMTGWDWVAKVSRWVAYDFDAIVGHSDKHKKKLTDLEILEIRNAVQAIPWIQVRKSTGGKGLHLYVFLETSPETSNRSEHQAIAKAILSQLSIECNFDFSQKVDAQGGNMWVWHRKMKGTDGLTIIKNNETKLPAPNNWRDYINVVKGKRQRNLPQYIESQTNEHSDIESIFNDLTGQRIRNKLDREHKKLYEWLKTNYPNAVWWDAEHGTLNTHTALLKEAHTALKLRGRFDTLAAGTEKGYDHNCFGYPIQRGAWVFRRYSLGCVEHKLWEKDDSGWTKILYNRDPSLAYAAKACEGSEDAAGAWIFKNGIAASEAALLLGADLKIPQHYLPRQTTIKTHRDKKRIVVNIERDKSDSDIEGWNNKPKRFEKIFEINQPGPSEPEAMKLDDHVRHITLDGADYSWAIKDNAGNWLLNPFQNAKVRLKSLGFDNKQAENIMGSSLVESWKLVTRPFQPEEPGNREWNRSAAQFRYVPSHADKDELRFPTWLKILTHIGKSMDSVILQDEWCISNGLKTGSDYLKCWIASMFQEPMEPLPYLFLYGPESCGKSILHEALSLLLTKGAMRADYALLSNQGFNGELGSAVLCIIEETNLQQNRQAHNKIKDWVTSREMPLHKKHHEPVLIPNATHWIQCANSPSFCPVFPGDTRITMVKVEEFAEGEHIPKRELIEMLQKEAPDFLTEMLTLELPKSNDRLNLPIVITQEKLAAEASNITVLDLFFMEKVYKAPGFCVKFGELYDAFVAYLNDSDPHMLTQWNKVKFGKELPSFALKGRWAKKDAAHYVGNISLTHVEETDFKPRFVLRDEFIVQETS